jgi:hypothetical protein
MKPLMKVKNLIGMLVLVGVISGCVSKASIKDHTAANTSENVATTTGTVDALSWKIYRNEDLGMQFRYPGNFTVKEESEIKNFDAGHRKNIIVSNEQGESIFSVVATSPNFREGVGKGCCFYYAGASIKPQNTNEQDLKPLDVFGLKSESIGDTEILKFYRINSYATLWVTESVLIPLRKEPFSNILITGPVLVSEDVDTLSEVSRRVLTNKINTKKYLDDESVRTNQDAFEKILGSVEIFFYPDTIDTSDWKTYRNEEYGFEFKYPEKWVMEEGFLAAEKIKYSDIGSNNAQIHFGVYTSNQDVFLSRTGIYDFRDIQYRIANGIEKSVEKVYLLGKEYSRYIFFDGGRYEGESAGKTIIIVRDLPVSKFGNSFYLVFVWEELPGIPPREKITNVDFLSLISTLKSKY